MGSAARGPKPTLLDSVWELLRKKSCVIRLNQNFYVDYMGFIYWISGFIQTRHVAPASKNLPVILGGREGRVSAFRLKLKCHTGCSLSRIDARFRVYQPFFRITKERKKVLLARVSIKMLHIKQF